VIVKCFFVVVVVIGLFYVVLGGYDGVESSCRVVL